MKKAMLDQELEVAFADIASNPALDGLDAVARQRVRNWSIPGLAPKAD